MGWQERERNIQEALSVLKRQQRRKLKGSRVHQDARVEIRARQIALEYGDCGRCQNLIIKIKRIKRGGEGVALLCLAGESPLAIHRDSVYKPEKIPHCGLLVPFEQEE